MQSPLFDHPPLAGWLPDETLFSWCSRYHLVSCNRLPGATTNALFGHRSLGSAHDFPCRIDQFVETTHGDLGPAGSIISQHTLLPAFLPFQSRTNAQMAVKTVMGPSSGSLKLRLGLLKSHFRTNFPLKACPECMSEDTVQHGIAYWHRSHQLPGAWVCIHHGRLLLESTLKATGVQRFDWILPDTPYFRSVSVKPSQTVLQQFMQLAVAANELVRIPMGWHFNSAIMLAVLKERLQRSDLSSASSHLKIVSIGREFHAFIQPLHSFDEFHSLAPSETDAGVQACDYFGNLDRVTHPLLHLLMITWLFRDWAVFMEDYQKQLSYDKQAPSQERFDLHRQTQRDRWNAVLSGNHGATLQLLRSIEPDTHAWLCRNDQEWLRSVNQARPSLPNSGERSVDSEIQDQKLFSLTQAALDGLLRVSPNRSIRMTDLLQLVPHLKPFVDKLDTLPRTQLLLNQCVQRRSRIAEDLFNSPTLDQSRNLAD